jgi:hypothetical protein
MNWRRQLGIEVELVAQQQMVQQRLAEGGLAGLARTPLARPASRSW